MSGKIFECGYGAIVMEDVEVLEACLEKLCSPGAIVRICEIGAHDGGTALGIKRYVESHGATLEYWGIEPDIHRVPFIWPGGTLIQEDSATAWAKVPVELDLVWVDGCHCKNHVIMDTVNFSPKVRNFGFILYHDINPHIQGVGEKQPCGPVDVPEFNVFVNGALEAIRWPWGAWELFRESYPLDQWGCGTRAYRKGRAMKLVPEVDQFGEDKFLTLRKVEA